MHANLIESCFAILKVSLPWSLLHCAVGRISGDQPEDANQIQCTMQVGRRSSQGYSCESCMQALCKQALCSDLLCRIKLGTAEARLIKEAKLIAWDEAPMLNRRCYEVVDNTLREIMGAEDPALQHVPFGGKVVVFGTDMRQIMPVIRQNSRASIVNACINISSIWQHVQVMKLTENMRAVNTAGEMHLRRRPVFNAILLFKFKGLSKMQLSVPSVTFQKFCRLIAQPSSAPTLQSHWMLQIQPTDMCS